MLNIIWKLFTKDKESSSKVALGLGKEEKP
jgi:hypothetical protein